MDCAFRACEHTRLRLTCLTVRQKISLPNNKAELLASMERTEQQPLKIGTQNLHSAVILAPMTGVTDLPFRRLAHDLGAGLVVSEMVAGDELVRQQADLLRKPRAASSTFRASSSSDAKPHWMAEGARMAEGLGANVVDINMGCPAREVTGKLSGSALMRDLDHAEALIRAVVGAVSVPVTLKMRLGWDEEQPQRGGVGAAAPRPPGSSSSPCMAARGASSSRAAPIGTRVREVRRPSPSPSSSTATSARSTTRAPLSHASGAAGVMIGRGAYGAPWLPGQIAEALRSGRRSGAPAFARQQAAIADEHVRGDADRTTGRRWACGTRASTSAGTSNRAAARRDRQGWRRRLCTEDDPARGAGRIARILRRAPEAPDESPRKPQTAHRSRQQPQQPLPARAGSAALQCRRPPGRGRARHAACRPAAPDPRAREDNRIVYANSAAEAFLSTGIA